MPELQLSPAATFLPDSAGLAQAGAPPVAPIVLLILCAVAGIGTVMLLPGRRETSWRTIGGVVLLVAGLIFAALLVRWTADMAAGGMGVYFWIFAALAIAGSLRVITHPKPVYSALYFVLTVFATAGLFLLLWAEFMAAALVLIYAGAILVTYVFVIMLAAEAAPPKPFAAGTHDSGALSGVAEHDAVSREPLAACAVGFVLLGMILFVIFDRVAELPRATPVPTVAQLAAARAVAEDDADDDAPTTVPARTIHLGATQELGTYLFAKHLVNLELAGLILTVAMVGAIVIARKRVVSETAQPTPTVRGGEVVVGPFTPTEDNPHSIPVYGTTNPRQKEYPET